jgi:hypothetical protein
MVKVARMHAIAAQSDASATCLPLRELPPYGMITTSPYMTKDVYKLIEAQNISD